MRPLAQGLVVAIGLAVAWSTAQPAQAAPARGANRHKNTKRPVKVAPPAPRDDSRSGDDANTPTDDAPTTRTEAKQVTRETKQGARDGKQGAPDPKQVAPEGKQGARELEQGARDGKQGAREPKQGAPDPKQVAPEGKQVALETRDAASDGLDPTDARDSAKLVGVAPAPTGSGWQVAIGPYLWASSVSADVSLGGSVSTGIDIGFIPLERHAKYGAEVLAEVRHGRFAISGDLMYGVAAVNGSTNIASVMMTLTGNASSLLIDGAASYQVLGDEDALFSLEARAGVRYQRTEVSGALDVAGLSLQSPDAVDDGCDALVGTRAVLRPTRWLALSGLFDYGVVGASDRTWSASGDASFRVMSHVLVMAGYRTLTMERARVSLSMQGPRVAVQLVF
jgi:hypothetical protein